MEGQGLRRGDLQSLAVSGEGLNLLPVNRVSLLGYNFIMEQNEIPLEEKGGNFWTTRCGSGRIGRWWSR